jgi:hypothetical protein
MEVLVAARDLAGSAGNPTGYRKGDVVIAFPDGHVWGAAEVLPNFWRITVTSLVGDDRNTLIEAVVDQFVPAQLVQRRKRFLDITQLSIFAQNNLASSGTATVLRLAFLNAMTLRT